MVVPGVAVGLTLLGKFRLPAGAQVYEVPPEAFKTVEAPLQIVTSLPALAVGNDLTVTVTTSTSLHAPLLTVKV